MKAAFPAVLGILMGIASAFPLPARASVELCAATPGALEQALSLLNCGLEQEEAAVLRAAPVAQEGQESCRALELGVEAARVEGSTNFANLTGLLGPQGLSTRIHLSKAQESLESWLWHDGKPKLEPFVSFFSMPNFVSATEGVAGQTLFPALLPLILDTLYTEGTDIEVYVADDQSPMEISKTLFHELVHAVVFRQTLSPVAAGHEYGDINRRTRTAEQETEERFKARCP
jgi:hypothetical protein